MQINSVTSKLGGHPFGFYTIHSADLVIAGFVGSGPIVLLLEALLHIGTKPTFGQRVILYFATSAVILAGKSWESAMIFPRYRA